MRHLLVGVVVFLVLQGCQYSPDEDNFQEKSIPDPSAIDLSQIFNEDTLFIPVTSLFSISVLNYENREIYESYAFVDGEHLAQSNGSPKLEFRIDPQSYLTGVHTLEIVFALSSGSGSLADMLEVEKLGVSKKWKFEVDNATPTKVEILDVSYNDGAVKVEWSKYNRKNFSHYEIGHGSFYRQDIKDINTTSFIDTTYVGGERIYYLQVYNQQDRSSSSSSKTYNDDGLRIEEIKIADQKFHIKWNKSKYNKAFKSYIIRNWNGSAPIEKTSITDTSITLSPAGIELGHAEDVLITAVGKAYDPTRPSSLNEYPTETVKLYQGEKVLDHDFIKYISSTNSLYTSFEGKVFRLNADNLDTLAVTNQLIEMIDVSKNGEYAYSIYSSSLFKRNPLTLVTEKVISINTLLGQTNVRVTGLFVSDNNMVAIKTYGKYWIIDMNTNSIIHQGVNVYSKLNLSGDFNFLYDGAKLYGKSAGVYSPLINLAGTDSEVEFNANFPDEAIILGKNPRKLSIIKPWTNTLVREFQPKDYASWVMVDEKTNLAVFHGGDHNYIYDLSTGNLKMDLGYSSSSFYYILFNNHLYRGSYLISLDQYQP